LTYYNQDSSDKILNQKNLTLTNMKSRVINCRESKNQILLPVNHEKISIKFKENSQSL